MAGVGLVVSSGGAGTTGSVVGGPTGLTRALRWWNDGFAAPSELLWVRLGTLTEVDGLLAARVLDGGSTGLTKLPRWWNNGGAAASKLPWVRLGTLIGVGGLMPA